ncbi:ATP-binding protein [Tropicimonas sp.]|uniref:ATP-binding protein n=1 Tax=Tropicimonas sp. TaxID=2067044 RepID=UPI003A872D0A
MDGISDRLQAQLRAQQIQAVEQLGRPMMLANLAVTTALVLMLWLTGQLGAPVAAWAAASALVSVLELRRVVRRERCGQRTEASKRSVGRHVKSATVFGLLWAVAATAILPNVSGTAQAFMAAAVTGMIGGGAIALLPMPAAAASFVALVCGGALLGLAIAGDLLVVGGTIIAAAFIYFFSKAVRRHSSIFVAEFVSRLELEEQNRLIRTLLDEARIEAAGERQRAEFQLSQTRKMEAIGQLTAGIAHDFNNLLTTIQGNAELIGLLGRPEPEQLDAILAACRRGSDTIQRLLAVTHKQRLSPRMVTPGELIAGLQPLMEGALGQSIQLNIRFGEGLWQLEVDSGRLESSILNLAINARDAMPEGGTLTIACRNLPEGHSRLSSLALMNGDFVEISVRDTGRGMNAEVQRRALDLFFTTNRFGESSGLGLPMVASFVRQSGGEIHLESTPGKGTLVSLYLPRATGQADGDTARVSTETPLGDYQVVLLVEDDAAGRETLEKVTESLNYRVVCCADPAEAIRILDMAQHVDIVLSNLLFHDGSSGFALAREIHARLPKVPVVFMSKSVEPDGDDSHVPVLGKPFSRDRVARFLRDGLLGTAAA